MIFSVKSDGESCKYIEERWGSAERGKKMQNGCEVNIRVEERGNK